MGARLLTFSETIQMVTETCCECGVVFAMTEDFRNRCKAEGFSRTFYCPNGHGQGYREESHRDKAARLQRELEAAKFEKGVAETRLREEQARLRMEQERHAAEVKRAHKRSAAGVCPCCHRTVSQMARHMKTKHPDFTKG